MNLEELKEFEAKRKQSPHVQRKDVDKLVCYGCAHSAALEEYPSRPSGERPCCSCVRNPELEKWRSEAKGIKYLLDDEGNAYNFDPLTGHAYNGGPYVHFPMDNYVTMDQRDQEEFLRKHSEYAKPIRVVDGKVEVVTE